MGADGLDAWSNAFTFDELQAVIAADLAGRKTDAILEKKNLRSVKPFTFKHDTISNKLMVIVLKAESRDSGEVSGPSLPKGPRAKSKPGSGRKFMDDTAGVGK